MNNQQMLNIVEQFSRQGPQSDGAITVTRVADRKTVFVEHIANGDGRGIVLAEYKVDGKTYWAGYSTRSQTVYVSLA